MAGILSGLLGLLGGPGGIIKRVGEGIGSIVSGIGKKKPFLDILGDVGKKIIGINDVKEQMKPQLANARPMIVPKDLKAPVRALPAVARMPTTTAGFPTTVSVPVLDTSRTVQRRFQPELERQFAPTVVSAPLRPLRLVAAAPVRRRRRRRRAPRPRRRRRRKRRKKRKRRRRRRARREL